MPQSRQHPRGLHHPATRYRRRTRVHRPDRNNGRAQRSSLRPPRRTAAGRADGVDDQSGAQIGQRRPDPPCDVERCRFGGVDRLQPGREGLRFVERPTGDDQADRGVVLEGTRDIPPEVAVTAEDEDAEAHATRLPASVRDCDAARQRGSHHPPGNFSPQVLHHGGACRNFRAALRGRVPVVTPRNGAPDPFGGVARQR